MGGGNCPTRRENQTKVMAAEILGQVRGNMQSGYHRLLKKAALAAEIALAIRYLLAETDR